MEKTSLDWHLCEDDFFNGLPVEKDAFMSMATKHEIKKNAVLFLREEPGNSCFYVQEGVVKIFNTTPEGKEPIFFLRKQGEMFGIAEVIDGETRKANAETLMPAIIWELNKADFETLLNEHAKFSKRVIQVLGRRIRYLGQTIEDLMVCDVTTRLAKLLLYLSLDAMSDPEALGSPVGLSVSLTQEQMASMTGSCQQTISETLKSFQEKGMIKMEKRRIVILKPLFPLCGCMNPD